MSDFTPAIAWSGKDALGDGDANKVISGDDFDTEFSGVQTAVNSKYDSSDLSATLQAYDADTAKTDVAQTWTAVQTMTSKQFQFAKGADIASATALPLLTDGNYFDVTGTTTVTSIDTSGVVGTVIKLHFDGALILTHHATDLILPGGANITTVAGDEAEFVEYASGDFRCTNYSRENGQAVAGKQWEWVSTTALTAAADITTANFVAGYDYRIRLENFCPTTDSQVLWLRISDDNDSTIESGSTDYAYDSLHGASSAAGSTGAAQMVLSSTINMGNDANSVNLLDLEVIHPNNSSFYTIMSWSGLGMDSSVTPAMSHFEGHGISRAVAAVTNIQFLFSGGSTFKAQGNILVERKTRA